MLQNLIPMLNVSHLETSLNFYQTVLGFAIVSPLEAVTAWRWATIRAGKTELMLSETEAQLNLPKNIDPQIDVRWPIVLYFYPDDVEALYREVMEQGTQPTPLIETLYGMREFSLQDPDGHVLSFGQDIA
jgi:uncharacterized glyoxalase superfamily protein PhnB